MPWHPVLGMAWGTSSANSGGLSLTPDNRRNRQKERMAGYSILPTPEEVWRIRCVSPFNAAWFGFWCRLRWSRPALNTFGDSWRGLRCPPTVFRPRPDNLKTEDTPKVTRRSGRGFVSIFLWEVPIGGFFHGMGRMNGHPTLKALSFLVSCVAGKKYHYIWGIVKNYFPFIIRINITPHNLMV